jgi:hypothetical protein
VRISVSIGSGICSTLFTGMTRLIPGAPVAAAVRLVYRIFCRETILEDILFSDAAFVACALDRFELGHADAFLGGNIEDQRRIKPAVG